MEAAARLHVAALERDATRSPLSQQDPEHRADLQASWNAYMSGGTTGETDDDSPWASIDAIADGISNSSLPQQNSFPPSSSPRFSTSPPSQPPSPSPQSNSEISSIPSINNVALTHVDSNGQAGMVDVSSKPASRRIATAVGKVRLTPLVFSLLQSSEGQTKGSNNSTQHLKEEMRFLEKKVNLKGPVLQTAKLAGIMGAKRTSDLIPLCHPISLSHIEVSVELQEPSHLYPHYHVQLSCTATTTSQTGVEMEALTGVNVAALTLWDMIKAVAGKEMVIEDVKVVRKQGGKSGDWERMEDDTESPL